MAAALALETVKSEDFGGIARRKNTRRLFVSPNRFEQLAVTGTWALELNSNVPSLATDDAGTTNVFGIPFPAEFSDMAVQSGSGVVDRGIRVVGLSVVYQVAVSALGGVDLTLYNQTINGSTGVVSAAAVTTTDTIDAADGSAGTEVDTHVFSVTVAARDRVFVASGTVPYAQFSATDGTSSDVNIVGAIWHVERIEE